MFDPKDFKDRDVVRKPGERMIDSKGITMVYVPTGKFTMGTNDIDDAKPQHEQIIKVPFYLDLTPVTNESYARFIADGGYRTQTLWTPDGWHWAQGERVPEDYSNFGEPKQPRMNVTWFEAYAYCQWRGGRLPTEAEWEWAARGPENRIYPWGHEFVSEYVIYGENSGGKTAVVGDGIRHQGASRVGALDMSGNVWEWCNSGYESYPFDENDGRESIINNDGNFMHVLRGGSWWEKITADLRADFRNGFAPDYGSLNWGFRCALPY